MTRAGWVAVVAIGCRFETNGVGGGTERLVDSAVVRDTSQALVQDTNVAPDVAVDTFDAGSERYFALEGPSDWYRSRDRCKELSAHLVTITTATELEAVKQLVSADAWLGLRLNSEAGTFEWITGEPFTLDAWRTGEPSGTGSCGKIAEDGQWLDHSCLEPLVAVCERD
jgi:hypothetical protein